ncbi:Dephospho-CoA kinase [hydrothermal vent metagenome]|uniref:Dephospho-CoA kinase n=1 Tax=hydrothermal vent metagenome TaxID=652676 RepID=A0A3B1D8W3_9ZZZZ
MVLVGLTGGIASGKSTVTRFFQTQGAHIVDADQICHELILQGNKAYQEIVSTFGKQILDMDGEINRGKLGHIIFQDEKQRETLNTILHPLVFKQLKTEQNRLRSENPQSVLIFDAPLLIESKAYQWMDWVILVYVDTKTQRERLIQRRSLTENEAKCRIAAQMPLEEKRAFADEIIDNRKPFDEIQSEVCHIYRRLLKKTHPQKSKSTQEQVPKF